MACLSACIHQPAAMEISVQIKKVTKPEDVITAFAALGQGQASSARNRPPIQRARREAMATSAATEIAQPYSFSKRTRGIAKSASPWTEDTDRGRGQWQENFGSASAASGVRPKMKPQPFSGFQRPRRQHQARTLSPGPYYQARRSSGRCRCSSNT